MSAKIDRSTQFLIACLKIKGVGIVTAQKLFHNCHFETDLTFDSLKNSNLSPLKKALSKKYLTKQLFQKYLDEAFFELQFCIEHHIIVINSSDSRYPINLLTLKRFPPILYLKGNIGLLNEPNSVAMIGTRHPSTFAQKFGQRLAEYFANEFDYTIVSGLAIGVDTVAHQGSLKTNHKTIAVLANGLDQPIYPQQNKNLAKEIVDQGGLLLSTYPINTKLKPEYLAARDEWQSGLSNGVVAIETGLKGGTNNAMNHAIKQKKPLAAVDHQAFFSPEIIKDLNHVQGNIEYIQDHKAYPLSTEESLKAFDQQMKRQRIQRIAGYGKTSQEIDLFN
ncbi:DNA-processing protein DprA [Companilactobacillus furfuricola]|uniref:DNA-processing protein DprA n=1 Tax=Companilactobacillus furfuricola TaxID=1462575 RepID=UPI000F7AD77D|nr:DNA-processing protein DprA [Companilactobacillus furfuricola]